MPKINNQEIQNKARRFFECANAAVLTDAGRCAELWGIGRAKMVHSTWFELTDELKQALSNLTKYCLENIKHLRIKERDIIDIAWNHAAISIIMLTPPLEESKNFISSLDDITLNDTVIFLPNCAVNLSEGARKITIGPVQILRGEEAVPELCQILKAEPSDFVIGNTFTLNNSRSENLFLNETIWRINLRASERKMIEQARWMTESALSLIRLKFPLGLIYTNPSMEIVESLPFSRPSGMLNSFYYKINEEEFYQSRITSSSLHERMPYNLNSEMASVADTVEFDELANTIFHYHPGSLAERINRGLGWLARSRQSPDPAERLLLTFTAIETLLNSDETDSVTSRISRFIGVILTNDCQERCKVAAEIKQLYKLRSRVTHKGENIIAHEHDINIAQGYSELLYKNVLETCNLRTKFATFYENLNMCTYGASWPPAT